MNTFASLKCNKGDQSEQKHLGNDDDDDKMKCNKIKISFFCTYLIR